MQKRLLLRGLVFASGMFVSASGIGLITNSDLGTTPLTSIPLAANAILPLTIGTYTFFMNVFFVAMQKVLLGPKFRLSTLWQFAPVAFFSASIDFWMHATRFLPALPYGWRAAALLGGIVLSAAGISAQVGSGVVVMPGEGILLAAMARTGLRLGTLKVALDVSMVSVAAAMGLAFLGGVVGIREGTLASAVLTGVFIRWFGTLARRAGLPGRAG